MKHFRDVGSGQRNLMGQLAGLDTPHTITAFLSYMCGSRVEMYSGSASMSLLNPFWVSWAVFLHAKTAVVEKAKGVAHSEP